jgi:ABC-2 type transport system permease protein
MQNILIRLTPFFTLIEREVYRNKRVVVQAIVAPLITASLYIFIFGYIVGPRIGDIQGIKYISFVFPGIFTMNLILAVFSATSFSIYFMKFQKTLEDFLTLPISYVELVLSLIVNGLFRGLAIMVALSIVGIAFGVNTFEHPLLLVFYVLLVSFVFGLMGIVAGIWADNSFEKFGIITNFVITPLSFLGGAFYSVSMLPESMRFLVHLNPLFYATDGIRYALTGQNDSSILLGLTVLTSLAIIFLGITVWIFKTGWKLRS